MMGLTKRQSSAFDFIVAYIAEHKISPSLDEIQRHLGDKSKSSASRLVHAMKDRGVIGFNPRQARSITVLKHSIPAEPPLVLPPTIKADLDAFCRERGEDPLSVIADAVALHLDSFQVQEVAA